jgi:hypothetical protein
MALIRIIFINVIEAKESEQVTNKMWQARHKKNAKKPESQ